MVALLVVFTIVVCVCADSVVQWSKARRESAARRLADELAPTETLSGVSAPANVFLDEGHTWVKVSPTGRADVGLDAFAQKLIGRVDAVVLPEPGRAVHRGDVLFTIRQDRHRAAFASPVDGVVAEVDERLSWHPEALQGDVYGDAWVCSVSPTNLSANLKELRTADEAAGWLASESSRFRDLLAARAADALEHTPASNGHGGGAALEYADDRMWTQFNEIFLHPTEHARN